LRISFDRRNAAVISKSPLQLAVIKQIRVQTSNFLPLLLLHCLLRVVGRKGKKEILIRVAGKGDEIQLTTLGC
jgi:hypothetical protein